VNYDLLVMNTPALLTCDGCGQAASVEHFARRLQRLEWSTRYRPVHMQALLISAVSPLANEEFLYSPGGEHQGEAAQLLDAIGIVHRDRAPDAVLTEFQRRGLYLTYMLECPMEFGVGDKVELGTLLDIRFNTMCAKIRRSFKPKRVVIFSRELRSIAHRFVTADLGCPVELDSGKPFDLENAHSAARFGAALPFIATTAKA
jgi:hypothetical protein